MKVLIVGGGGREHAIAWKLRHSPLVKELYCTPGNAGIAELAEVFDVKANDIDGLLALARQIKPDLTIVGPEEPLSLGFVDAFQDAFQKENFRIFGPSRAAAILEASKVAAKDFMYRHNIPTAPFMSFGSPEKAKDYVRQHQFPLVIKADGLAAGKGVLICKDVAEAIAAVDLIMVEKKFGAAGNSIVVESFLPGEEVSYIIMVDTKGNYEALATSQDHKRVGDGDAGLNTGGMGAYSPARIMTSELDTAINEKIIKPTIKGMEKEGRPYVGFLYFGLMIADSKPYLLEYNVRLGDPETQPIMLRMESDLAKAIMAALNGDLDWHVITWYDNPAVCVVMASKGYPEAYDMGYQIFGIEEAEKTGAVVFHAGTALSAFGVPVTQGGRVLGVTAMGKDFAEAKANAYEAVKKIECYKLFYRNDIADRAINR